MHHPKIDPLTRIEAVCSLPAACFIAYTQSIIRESIKHGWCFSVFFKTRIVYDVQG